MAQLSTSTCGSTIYCGLRSPISQPSNAPPYLPCLLRRESIVFSMSRGASGRRVRLATVYILVCLVLSVLAFVPQESDAAFFYTLFIVTLPGSLPAALITY